MNGPVECLKKLPCIDEKYCPQVSFLGPQDELLKKAGKKVSLQIDTEIAYDWLQVWIDANYPRFINCIIDTSDNVRDEMNHVTKKFIDEAITTTDSHIINISSLLNSRVKKIQKECVTLVMKLYLQTQFILWYYQNCPSSMQTSIHQSRPCWK
jgi:hypothetical protein